MSVLEEEGCVYERAFAMDLDDLHSLLRAFNRKGVRFVNVQELRGAQGEKLPSDDWSGDGYGSDGEGLGGTSSDPLWLVSGSGSASAGHFARQSQAITPARPAAPRPPLAARRRPAPVAGAVVASPVGAAARSV